MFSYKQFLNIKTAFSAKKNYAIGKNQKGRRFVIPDIHGCFDTFMVLLDKICFSKDDFLFLLGDYINRGKKSKEVLDKITELIYSDYPIFPLRGNHEQRIIEKHLKNYTIEELNLPKQYHNKEILSDNKIKNEYLGFISNLPYYYELDDYYLVHAGFNFDTNDFLSDYESMIWLIDVNLPDKIQIEKQIIIGHKPRSIEEIRFEIQNRKIIHLDNGCVYKSNPKYGNLLCLELDTKELFIQKNIEESS